MTLSTCNINLDEISTPFFIYKPDMIKKKVEFFLNYFSGETLYAVKTNPSKFVLKTIYKFGIKSFDVASLTEIKLIKSLFKNAIIYFMNPVKSRYAIKEAYFNYGVKHFSLDSFEELTKIVESTNFPNDLNLHLRISIPNNFSKIKLTKKFGIEGNKAKALLNEIKNLAKNIGVSFHPGSQCMNVKAYKLAINKTVNLIKESDIEINYFNVGGGFPSKYPGMNPDPLKKYFDVINTEFSKYFNKNSKTILLSEPGRALVSNSMSLIVKVNLRKKNKLYINDGVHGYLHNAGVPGFIYPVKIFRKENKSKLVPFSFYGPTCDSNDYMKGPFFLPDTINEGDYIELEEMGAYSITMKNNFNGFYTEPKVFIEK
tara:strand:+ start:4312 stop:5424 length:1113 start_codon:yes stop_codon:yes gene_type:complete